MVRKVIFGAMALAVIGLGGLWLLQGLGLVVIQPILCVANCVPVVGPSAPWVVAGLVALAVGVLLLRYAVRRVT